MSQLIVKHYCILKVLSEVRKELYEKIMNDKKYCLQLKKAIFEILYNILHLTLPYDEKTIRNKLGSQSIIIFDRLVSKGVSTKEKQLLLKKNRKKIQTAIMLTLKFINLS